MGLSKYKLGELIELCDERNLNLKFGIDKVKGISIQKTFMPTKANMQSVSLEPYFVVRPDDFAYVTVTSRNAGKITLAHNTTNETFICSSSYVVFCVKKKDLLLSNYLFMYFNRTEFDRYARFNSWGSAREVFSFEDMCEVEIELPPLEIQQRFVDIYTALVANAKSYEKGLADLKLTCDAFIDKLKHQKQQVAIRNFVHQIDNRNNANQPFKFKGLSMDNYFIDSIADANGLDFSNYKIVAPNEYGAVLMKVGRDEKLTIAQNDSNESYIISPAYYTFKTANISQSYFMANVSRSEFERRGWFSCDTSARGSLSWEEFLNLTIPNADKKEQQIVENLYNAQKMRFSLCENLKSQIKAICPVLIQGSLKEGAK